MGVKVEEGGRTAACDLKRVRSMPPWEVKMLSCGPCECIHQQSPSPNKRAKECLKADGETAIQSILHTTVHAEHTVPYKKRKIKLSFVKKSVKFSPASQFRVVHCVPGEWCELDSDDSDWEEANPSTSGEGSSAQKMGAHCLDAVGISGDQRLPSTPQPAVHHVLEVQMTPDASVYEHKIVTKDGDGPSTIGLICNSLIMGLVDRRIINADTALDAMRVVLKSAADDYKKLPEPSSPTTPLTPVPHCASACLSGEADDDDMPIGEHVFEAVLDRLEQLVEHLDRHDRVGLLPSTARLGKPFIPALKCLHGTLRLAAKELYPGVSVEEEHEKQDTEKQDKEEKEKEEAVEDVV